MAKTRQTIYVIVTTLFHSSKMNITKPRITYFTKIRKRNFQYPEKLRLFLLSALPEPTHASGYLICFWIERGMRRGKQEGTHTENLKKKRHSMVHRYLSPLHRSPPTAAPSPSSLKKTETFHLSPLCQYSITPVSSPRNVSKLFVPCHGLYSSSWTCFAKLKDNHIQ